MKMKKCNTILAFKRREALHPVQERSDEGWRNTRAQRLRL